MSPDELLADTLYGSDDNHQTAKAANVTLVAPVHKGNATNTSYLTGFAFDDKGYVTACPAGHSPERVRYKKKTDRFSAAFSLQLCQSCPLIGQCKLKASKSRFSLHYSNKQRRLEVRRTAEKNELFAETYRWRAGVEATMSEFDRRTGVKHLRVRGMPAVRFAATLKAVGLNILRAGAVRKARRKARRTSLDANSLIHVAFVAAKERILRPLSNLEPAMSKSLQLTECKLHMAA